MDYSRQPATLGKFTSVPRFLFCKSGDSGSIYLMVVMKGYICLALCLPRRECSINKPSSASFQVHPKSPSCRKPSASPEFFLSSYLQTVRFHRGAGLTSPHRYESLAHSFLEWQPGAERRK